MSVDIEYAIQYLQIMHGHDHAALRTPNAMQALAGLMECGIVSRQDGEHLRKAYLFLRMLIDGLRMVRGHAKDLVLPPADSDGLFSSRGAWLHNGRLASRGEAFADGYRRTYEEYEGVF